jgi:hypothetical protein
MILAMGRRDSDSSPTNSVANFCPAKMPLNIRMVDPELPQSSGPLGGRSLGPCPGIKTAFSFRCTSTPRAARHSNVLAQSAPVEKFSSLLVPSAIAANIAYR